MPGRKKYYDTKRTVITAAQLAAIAAKPVLTIREFCMLYGISYATFCNYRKAGVAPQLTRKLAHGHVFITREAADAWRLGQK